MFLCYLQSNSTPLAPTQRKTRRVRISSAVAQPNPATRIFTLPLPNQSINQSVQPQPSPTRGGEGRSKQTQNTFGWRLFTSAPPSLAQHCNQDLHTSFAQLINQSISSAVSKPSTTQQPGSSCFLCLASLSINQFIN